MKKEKIIRLWLVPFILFQVTIFGLIGLLFGFFYAFGGLAIDILVSLDWLSAEKMETPGLSVGTILAFGALLGMPLLGMAFGFLAGLLGGVLYNLIAPRFGGLNVPFVQKQGTKK